MERVLKVLLAVHFNVLKRVVMERGKRFPVFHDISYVTLQWHKNNELGVELIALEITLSLLLLGKLFVVMDEEEYVDFSKVLPDHCL